MDLVSQINPKDDNDDLIDEHWSTVMQENLNQFEKNNVWKLLLKHRTNPVNGTKWIFYNKHDENENILNINQYVL